MRTAEYGCDAYGNKVIPPAGWVVIEKHSALQDGDQPFDVYSGWLGSSFYNERYNFYAESNGRWTAWARKKIDQNA